LSALLAINRARDWDAFRRAVRGYAIPGQTLVYADREGHIGRLLAARLPRRAPVPPKDLLSAPSAAAAWASSVTFTELPAELDPACGFIVSANDRPPPAGVMVGWFFSPVDRASRLTKLIEKAGPIDLSGLTHILRDVGSASALALRDRLLVELPRGPNRSRLLAALRNWDGRYDAKSKGALAFELVVPHLVGSAIPPSRYSAYSSVWTTRDLLAQDLADLPAPVLKDQLNQAVRKTEARFARWRDWGSVHRLRLSHPLALMPGLRRRFRFGDEAWPGSNNTVMKAAHGPVKGPHTVSYGTNARYVFDLSDPDANYLVLLGGQDGAPGSAAFLDQAELFCREQVMRIPLRPETARAAFPHRLRIEPRA
jgi:penicillin amidase